MLRFPQENNVIFTLILSQDNSLFGSKILYMIFFLI